MEQIRSDPGPCSPRQKVTPVTGVSRLRMHHTILSVSKMHKWLLHTQVSVIPPSSAKCQTVGLPWEPSDAGAAPGAAEIQGIAAPPLSHVNTQSPERTAVTVAVDTSVLPHRESSNPANEVQGPPATDVYAAVLTLNPFPHDQ
jgi:hypothetical protein